MAKILIAIDDSPNALRAVAYMIKKIQDKREAAELHLINVQHPVHGGISTFIDAGQIKQWHHDEGIKALAAARDLLNQAGIAHQAHVFVGDPADVVARYANEQGYDEIVLGTRGQNTMSSMLLGSVSTKLLHLASIPVLLVK